MSGSILLLANRMKLFTPMSAGNFSCLYIALASYVVFLLWAIICRVGRGRQPLGRFNRLHFRIAVIYILASAGYLGYNGRAITLLDGCDWLIGLFVYFGLQYAIVGNFFGVAQASVSTSVISILHVHGGHATRSECMADYAGGEGFGYIKRTRLARIQNMLGWVEVHDGRYRLTRGGRRMTELTTWMLRLWGLSQIGKPPTP